MQRDGATFSVALRVLLAGLLASCLAPAIWAQQYDLLIKNARVLDGTGTPWYSADVAVSGERIVAAGDLSAARAKRILDAAGLYLAPGFIDPHSHAADGLVTQELSHARPLLAQGITTVFINPDGGGPVDLTGQRATLLEHGLGVNVAPMVPHGSVRRAVLGMEDRAPTEAELEQMARMVRQGMETGAFGLSTGLFYAPGSYAQLDEVIHLAAIVAEYDGVYTSHIRDESNYSIGLAAAVEEVIQVSRRARLPGIVTHIKALGPPVWGQSATVIDRIQQARDEGVEVFADQYPYTASATSLSAALLPRWAQVGGRDKLLARLEDPQTAGRIVSAMEDNLARRGGAHRIQFRSHPPDRSIEGKTLQAVAEERDVGAIHAALQLLKEGKPGIVSHNMDEADVRRFMQQPWVMTCTDGGLVPLGRGVPHPRNYGAFPRKIRKYVREEKVLDLASAIRTMTAMPAAVLRLRDRGIIHEGAVADLVVFDLERLTDQATYQNPHQLSQGMVYVLVNGTLAIDQGEFTGALAGKVLTRRGASREN